MNQTDRDTLEISDTELTIGVIIMASGHSTRFGSNKLLAELHGEPLVSYVLKTVQKSVSEYGSSDTVCLFPLVVTRHGDVTTLCKRYNISYLLHNEPYLNDTIRLGISSLLEQEPALDGCLFLQGDQPLLKAESIHALICEFVQNPDSICRLSEKGIGKSPVLFPASLFPELQNLPEEKGGGVLLRQYPSRIRLVEAACQEEFLDADTPEDLNYLSEIFSV